MIVWYAAQILIGGPRSSFSTKNNSWRETVVTYSLIHSLTHSLTHSNNDRTITHMIHIIYSYTTNIVASTSS